MSSSADSSQRGLVLASRASKLARIQTDLALHAFQSAHASHNFSASYITSEEGDKNKTQALYLLGGKSLWTKELEVALKEKAADILVHSLKDVPTVMPEGCEIAAVLERASPLDALVVKTGKPWKSLEDLPDGSVIGTGSIRRVAQLKRHYPRLHFMDARGNLDTRLNKLDAPEGPYAALVLAKAGLVRSGLEHRVTCDLVAPQLYHAVGQGAIGIEIRSDDALARQLCTIVTHWPTHWVTAAERAMLRVLEGGCSVPVGVTSNLEIQGERSGTLTLHGSVTSIGGEVQVDYRMERAVESLEEAEKVGIAVAEKLAEIGGKEILDEVNADRAKRIGEDKSAEEKKKLEAMIEPAAQAQK
ncbi:porphobilinogen deaminase [Pterulicium gracile]|uniref:hydroxymethylbilane synthase n=1 Tax=Pterulicium gracile TaxID=1884261 RepID=A0A5C3R0E4_9AGAR|nr:porphobilinogen deaminase [Pterula gracilis]